MRSSSSVGLGLSLVFGCLLLALIAELYYLLWCKKRVANRDIQDTYNSPASEFLYLFCWKKPSSLTSTGLATDTQVHEPQPPGPGPGPGPAWLIPIGTQDCDDDHDMMSHMTIGPPRFLFTIKEETREDLESEDKSKRGSRGRSLSDVSVNVINTPYFTPLGSPPLTPRDSTCRPFTPFTPFSPLKQSSSDAEFNRVWASPPPKFKFLRDAEDKLQKKILNQGFGVDDDANKISDESGSFITLIVSKDKAKNELKDKEVDHRRRHQVPVFKS